MKESQSVGVTIIIFSVLRFCTLNSAALLMTRVLATEMSWRAFKQFLLCTAAVLAANAEL
jgi:hypothetical protein